MRVCTSAATFNRSEAAGAAFESPAMTLPASRIAVSPRPYLSTEDAADLLCRQPQTLRKSHALTGTFLGVRPRKVGRRLLWPRVALMALITGEATSTVPESESLANPVQG